MSGFAATLNLAGSAASVAAAAAAGEIIAFLQHGRRRRRRQLNIEIDEWRQAAHAAGAGATVFIRGCALQLSRVAAPSFRVARSTDGVFRP